MFTLSKTFHTFLHIMKLRQIYLTHTFNVLGPSASNFINYSFLLALPSLKELSYLVHGYSHMLHTLTLTNSYNKCTNGLRATMQ